MYVCLYGCIRFASISFIDENLNYTLRKTLYKYLAIVYVQKFIEMLFKDHADKIRRKIGAIERGDI